MHRHLALALLALVCNSILVFPIAAQEPVTTGTVTAFPSLPQQQQVSFDYNGKLMRLTWEFEKQFAILRSYPYLHEARLFQAGDTAFTLEATHIVDGKIERELKPLTMQEVSRIRYETSEALRSFAMWGNEERTAVWEDWVLGAGTFGWGLATGALRDVLDAPLETKIWWLIPTFTTELYIWCTHQSWYNRPAATMWWNGLWQGTMHGFALAALLTNQPSGNQPTITGSGVVFTGMIMGLIEASVSISLAQNLNLRQSEAELVGTFGGSGLAIGFLAPLAINQGIPIQSDQILTGAVTLVGGISGMLLGGAIGASSELTAGDARVIGIPSHILGALPFSLAIKTNQSTRLASLATLATIVSGHLLGAALVHEKDFSFLQGQIISTLCGGSAAFFLNMASSTNLFSPTQSLDNSITLPIITTAISAVGFTVSYLLFVKEAEEQHQRRLTATGAQAFAPRTIPHEVTWWENIAANTDVQFSPLGLLPLVSPASVSGLGLGAVGMGLPIMSIRTVLGSPVPKPIPDDEIIGQR